MKKQYWYRISIDQADGEYSYCGTSELTEKELVEKLKTEDYLFLDNLIWRNNQGHVKSWTDWLPNVCPRIYINPKRIISVQVLKEAPKETNGKTRK